MKKRAALLLIIPGWLLVTQVAPAGSAPRTSVCHLDEDEGTWELLNISENAVTAHLIHHDDGAPGAATVITATQLDANCQPVAAPVETPLP